MTTMRQYTLRPGTRMAELYDKMPRELWMSAGEVARLSTYSDARNALAALVARGLVIRREATPGDRDWLYLKRPEDEAISKPTVPPVFGPPERGIEALPEMGVREQPQERGFEYVFVPKPERSVRPWLNGAPVGQTIKEHRAGVVEKVTLEIVHGTARCYMLNDCREPECVEAYNAAAQALGLS